MVHPRGLAHQWTQSQQIVSKRDTIDRVQPSIATGASADEWNAFFAVVRHQSFTQAARALGVQKSAVSKRVASLEAQVGVALFVRTTRAVVVTEAGRALATRASAAFASLDEAIEQARSSRDRPTGRVRVTAPLVFGDELLSPLIAPFLARFPEVDVELLLLDRRVDLVRESVDVAIRASPLVDSSLLVRKLGPAESALVASPAYLARAGTPSKLGDLAHHALCVFTNSDARTARLEVRSSKGSVVIDRAPRLVCTSQIALRQCLVDGAGIGMIPWYLARHAIDRGALIEVLEQHRAPSATLQLLTARTQLTSAVRAFVATLTEAFRGHRPWVRAR